MNLTKKIIKAITEAGLIEIARPGDLIKLPFGVEAYESPPLSRMLKIAHSDPHHGTTEARILFRLDGSGIMWPAHMMSHLEMGKYLFKYYGENTEAFISAYFVLDLKRDPDMYVMEGSGAWMLIGERKFKDFIRNRSWMKDIPGLGVA